MLRFTLEEHYFLFSSYPIEYPEVTAGYLILSRDGRTDLVSLIVENDRDRHRKRVDFRITDIIRDI